MTIYAGPAETGPADLRNSARGESGATLAVSHTTVDRPFGVAAPFRNR